MSRQRIRSSIQENISEICPHCDGKGSLRTAESISLEIFREISEASNDKRVKKIDAEISIEVLNFITNNKRNDLTKLENETSVSFKLIGNNNFRGKESKITSYDINSNILGKNKDTKEKNTQNKKTKENSKKKRPLNKKESQKNQKNTQNKKAKDKKESKMKETKENDKNPRKETSKKDKIEAPKNKNYIGAPIEDKKEIKDKKTGWWNK